MDLINSLTSQVLNRALDGMAKRHQAISSNLANVDTPGYRRQDACFETDLKRAIDSANGREAARLGNPQRADNNHPLEMLATQPGHFYFQDPDLLEHYQPHITENEDLEYRNDGNSVDVETEMAQLAKNTQRYLAVSNLENREIKGLKTIINGGGN